MNDDIKITTRRINMPKSLVNKDERDDMVVLLEGMPEGDIDAELPEGDESESIEEAMEAAIPMEGGGLPDQVSALADSWEPTTPEGEQYKMELQELLASFSEG